MFFLMCLWTGSLALLISAKCPFKSERLASFFHICKTYLDQVIRVGTQSRKQTMWKQPLKVRKLWNFVCFNSSFFFCFPFLSLFTCYFGFIYLFLLVFIFGLSFSCWQFIIWNLRFAMMNKTLKTMSLDTWIKNDL